MTAKGSPTTLVHSVYFALKDNSDRVIEQCIAQCDNYLADHPGLEYSFAGRRAAELNRQVNDDRFDVAVLVAFKDQPSHDSYQTADMHNEFIEKTRDGWEDVRVFDAAGPGA